MCSERMRNDGHKPQPGIRNTFFTLSVVKHEGRLHRKIPIAADIQNVTEQDPEQPDKTSKVVQCRMSWFLTDIIL